MQQNIRTIGSAIDKIIDEPIVIKDFTPKKKLEKKGLRKC
jgi:hypothetical protein